MAPREILTQHQIVHILHSTFKFDPNQAATLRRMLPLFEQHGDRIVERMFQHLFQAHPELQRFFPRSNHVTGQHLQAIANAVCMLMENPDELGALMPIIRHISHTHHSVQVEARYYTWIGESLTAALTEFIEGADATKQLQTLVDIYTSMSDFLIKLESLQRVSG